MGVVKKPMWKTLKDAPIDDIKEFIRTTASGGQEVYIGTDSLQSGRYTQFVTVVAILTPGKGGRAAYKKDRVPKIRSLRERLLREVWLSVELGLQVTDFVPGRLTVAVDANPDLRYASSRYIQELVGLVVGQGFKVQVKPESLAATHIADHAVRSLGKVHAAV